MPLGKITLSETPGLNLTTDYSINELTLFLVSQLDFGGLCGRKEEEVCIVLVFNPVLF